MSYEHHIGDIKKNSYFCEFDGSGLGVRFQAIEDGYLTKANDLGDEYWTVRGRKVGTEEIVTFSVHKKYLHYGPELYPGTEIPYINVKFLN